MAEQSTTPGVWNLSKDGLPPIGAEVIGGHFYRDTWLNGDPEVFLWGRCTVVPDNHRDFKDGKRWCTFGPSHNDITHWCYPPTRPESDDERHQRLEREHMGDPDLKNGIYAPRPTGMKCSACDLPQFDTPSGPSCDNGHGGAELAEDAERFAFLASNPYWDGHAWWAPDIFICADPKEPSIKGLRAAIDAARAAKGGE